MLKNLIIRALTGILFVAVLVGAICYRPVSFLIVFGLITWLTLWEFYGLIKHYEKATLKRAISSFGGVYLFVATFMYANQISDGIVFLPYILFLMYTLVAELYSKVPNPINDWSFTMFAQVYCAGTFSMLNFLATTPSVEGPVVYSPLFVLAVFVFIWLNDTGAYLFGTLFGKRRLFERISPKKSWEGFFGGMIVALAASQALAWYVPEVSWYNWLGLALTVVVFGTWGDLVESLLKRTLGVKDSGKMLPGHGGMLDRFDSLMLAAPAAYIYIRLFIQN